MAGLPRTGPTRVRPRATEPASCSRSRTGSSCPAPDGAPCRLTGQEMAAGHPSGLCRRGAPTELPQRIRVPVQPSSLAQPRDGVLPHPPTHSRSRPRPLPRPRHDTKTEEDTTAPARSPRTSTKRATPARRPTMAQGLGTVVTGRHRKGVYKPQGGRRLDGYPHRPICRPVTRRRAECRCGAPPRRCARRRDRRAVPRRKPGGDGPRRRTPRAGGGVRTR